MLTRESIAHLIYYIILYNFYSQHIIKLIEKITIGININTKANIYHITINKILEAITIICFQYFLISKLDSV